MYDRVNVDRSINMTTDHSWMGAADASRLLRVSRTTLYAYVSRGYVRSQATAGRSRERLYSRDDIERLRRRTEARRDPDKATARSLQWGLPVLESSIAFIDGQRLYYRGHDAVELARSRSVAEIASLIWSGRFDGTFSPGPPRLTNALFALDRTLAFVARAQAVLAAASVRDHAAFDLRAGSVSQTAGGSCIC
jgi:citrate synthase